MSILERLNGIAQPIEPDMTAAELAALNVQLEAKLLRLASQLHDLRSENTALRRNVRRYRPDWQTVVQRAQRDALLMVALAVSGTETTRANCNDLLGLSNRRWYWARALSQMGGIHDGGEFYDDLTIQTATERIREAATLAEAQPAILRQFLPASMARR